MKREINVLYTRQKTQKSKTWHDGIVVIDHFRGTNKVSLYKVDDSGNKGELIECYSTYIKDLTVSKIKFPNHLLEIVDEQNNTEPNEVEVNKLLIANSSISRPSKPFKSPLIKVINKDKSEIWKSKQNRVIGENKNERKIFPKVMSIFNVSSKKNILKSLDKLFT
ncbi:ABC-transporter [Cryptosporidium xiaoi]|uniref:ABC-transporter n=1 Tax=Cryptosporidium xiaoi TaxID=659607 RepID=A0AAV9XSX7_9CRYT